MTLAIPPSVADAILSPKEPYIRALLGSLLVGGGLGALGGLSGLLRHKKEPDPYDLDVDITDPRIYSPKELKELESKLLAESEEFQPGEKNAEDASHEKKAGGFASGFMKAHVDPFLFWGSMIPAGVLSGIGGFKLTRQLVDKVLNEKSEKELRQAEEAFRRALRAQALLRDKGSQPLSSDLKLGHRKEAGLLGSLGETLAKSLGTPYLAALIGLGAVPLGIGSGYLMHQYLKENPMTMQSKGWKRYEKAKKELKKRLADLPPAAQLHYTPGDGE